MRGLVVEPEPAGKRAEAAVGHLVAHEAAGERARVDGRVAVPIPAMALEREVEEPEIEAHVVADDDGALAELEPRGQHGVDARGGPHHGLGDAGEHRDLGRHEAARVDERVERAEASTAADLDGADLGDAVVLRRAGGLEVDHAERDVGERGAQVVERSLHGCTVDEHPFVDKNRCSPVGPGRTAPLRPPARSMSGWPPPATDAARAATSRASTSSSVDAPGRSTTSRRVATCRSKTSRCSSSRSSR